MSRLERTTGTRIMMTKSVRWITAALLAGGLAPAWAQETPVVDHDKMGHGATPAAPPAAGSTRGGTADHGSMQGGTPPPDARDPHAYSGGYRLSSAQHMHAGDGQSFGSLRVDRFEHVRTRAGETSTAYELQARYGRDYNRFVLKAEGEVAGGEARESRTDLLWSRAVAAYWDLQAGMRVDGGEGPSRRWLAFGVQGLAPYWFEVDATLYIGDEGRSAFRVEAEYELLLTQKLILQPRLEANVYGKQDAANERGQGLSEVALGVRLRYEIRREFAPYIGIERVTRYGDTADLLQAAGKPTGETRFVAGLRFWF